MVGNCQQVLIIIAVILLVYVINIVTENCKLKMMINKESMVPSYCTPEYVKKASLIPKKSSAFPNECFEDDDKRENFTNTLKDTYLFNPIHTDRIREETSDHTLNINHIVKGPNNVDMLKKNEKTLNQLLYPTKLSFQDDKQLTYVENPSFESYWKEFGNKTDQVSENFCAYPGNVRGDSSKCKMSIENLENQHVRTYEHYTNRLKEPVNFNTYGPLFQNAGITNNDLLPKGYGSLHHNYLDRFKYLPSTYGDEEEDKLLQYSFKTEPFTNKRKNNYTEFLKENFVDNKVKNNHKQFVNYLKEKNVNGNKAKEYSIMSGDSNMCGSVLARDCFSNFGVCGSSSFDSKITSSDAYIKHKTFCQNLCKPVEECKYLP